ncbi:MAG: HAD family hydrolase [Candidatus Heimdallarchaeota archaeon]|nr:MAG: HAD family hydrolase [Candidatus Heimdallarchaeota archaeon]
MTFSAHGVIFDLDGTLIDSMRGFYDLVVDGLERRGVKLLPDIARKLGTELIEEYQTTPSGRGVRLVINLFWKVGRKAGLSRLKSIRFTYECVNQAKDVYYSAPLFPDVTSSLTSLQEAGFQLGVCTMASRKQLTDTLTKYKIKHFFNPNGLVSRDDIRHAKPNPEGILLAFRKCSVHPAKSYYIGDMPVDIIAGNDAGTRTIALTTGLTDKKIFEKYSQPTAIFDSLGQATSWILQRISSESL